MIINIFKKVINKQHFLLSRFMSTAMDTIMKKLDISMQRNQRNDFYTELDKFTSQKYQKSSGVDEDLFDKFVQKNPPKTMRQVQHLLYFSQRNRIQLTIQDQIINIMDFNKIKINHLVRFYHLLGYNLLDKIFYKCQLQLKKRLQTQQNLDISELSIKLILNVKYHRKVIERRKYQEYSIPVYLIQYLPGVLNQISDLDLSYLILYYSSCELEYYRGYDSIQHPIKILMTNLSQDKIQNLSLQTRAILNYVGANIYMTNYKYLSQFLEIIQDNIQSMTDEDFDSKFAGVLLNYNNKRLKLFNVNLLRQNILQRVIKTLIKQQQNKNALNRISLLIENIQKYPNKLLPLKKIQQIVLQLAKQNKLLINGIQLLALHNVDITNIIEIVIHKKLIVKELDQIRWMIVLNHVNRQKYLTLIEIYENKLESILKSIAHVMLASLRKSLLFGNASFQHFCNKITIELAKNPQISLNDFQYFNFLILMMCSRQNHKPIERILTQMKLDQNEILEKKFVSACFQNYQKFNQNTIQCVYSLIQVIGIHPNSFISYCTQNRQLLYFLLTHNQPRFFQIIKRTSRLQELFKIIYFIMYCKLGDPDPIIKIAQKFPNYKDNWYRFVKTNRQ